MNYPPPNGYEPTDPNPTGVPQQPAYPPPYGQTEAYPPTRAYGSAAGPVAPLPPPAGPIVPQGASVPPPYQAPPSQGRRGPQSLAPSPVMYQPAPQSRQGGGAAVVVEIIAGLFGFWGVGWLMRGYTRAGALLLIGGLVFGAIMLLATSATFGAGLLCWAPLNLIAIVSSTITLSDRLKNGSPQR